MKLLILLQILLITIKVCKPEDEPETTVIFDESPTEMTLDRINVISGKGKKNEIFDNLRESENDGNDLDFDYDDEEDVLSTNTKDSENKEQEMQEVLLKAMKKPAIRKQIGEVIPILRVMSPAQRLTLAALVSSQIMSQNTISQTNLTEIAAMFAGKNVENANDRHNITEHLLLPISMDIAKMFQGLGREVGRNLRENFHRPYEYAPRENKSKRRTRKPGHRTSSHSLPPPRVANRRIDDIDYDQLEDLPSNSKPVAEALKQPGKDECDYFTKSLCLEVANYPTEAIIKSLKNNEEIAKTFLTDFPLRFREKLPPQTSSQNQFPNYRRLERRQDSQNKVQEKEPEVSYMCPSSLKYARPKRARATSGQWKYIVNAGDYTQTLRLEICQKPKSPCSFVTNHLNSQCAQIYNYHRLLTWDETKGLHMDIFKVPSCCSCQIQGYSSFYPPNNDFTYAEKRREPIEVTEHQPELLKRPLYNNAGFKREIPKPVTLSSSQSVTLQNQHPQKLNVKEFMHNPVDHLVPPGPPLPLENEGAFNQQIEPENYHRKGSLEHNRRIPVESENGRIASKATERVEISDSLGGLPVTSKARIRPPIIPQPQRPNFHVSNIRPSQEKNPNYNPPNQIRYIGHLVSTPPPLSNLETKRGLPKEDELRLTYSNPNNNNNNVNNNLFVQNVPKTVPKKPVQYFNPEYGDAKSLPSRVNPLYITPPSVKEVEIRHTTPTPIVKSEITSGGQKKINYNYHPIIDFFIADSKKRQPTYASPQYLPLSSQEWTPVVGH